MSVTLEIWWNHCAIKFPGFERVYSIRIDVKVYIVACDRKSKSYFIVAYKLTQLCCHWIYVAIKMRHYLPLTFEMFFSVYITENLNSCRFFDDEITTSIFFLTLHGDAMLHILNLHPPHSISERVKKIKPTFLYSISAYSILNMNNSLCFIH